MNKNQMHQIFAHYIDKFEMLNDKDHEEYSQMEKEFKMNFIVSPRVFHYN